MLALATAMGIGRFAFTPLLPMMLSDGVITLADASWLASANYLGYLVGALFCMFKPSPHPTVMIRTGLVGTWLLTLGMAVPWSASWPFLRFAAGLASALVFVYTSGWCLTQVALRGHARLSALIYMGPGAGIILTGLTASALVADGGRSASGWLVFGAMALVLTWLTWSVFHARYTQVAIAASQDAPGAPGVPGVPIAHHPATEIALFAVGYGVAGFGYIITATFLPVIARQVLPGSPWLDLFWPILGSGVIVGALIASRITRVRDLRWLLVACYLCQAAGIVLSLVMPHLGGFVLGSFLVGLPFTAITYFAMQEVRRVRPLRVASTMALLTALYGLGQILGPPMATFMLHQAPTAAVGFDGALEIAAGSLLLGAVVFGALIRSYPVEHCAE
jgi:MFS family permease